jgi:hypothetical protein
MAEIRLGHWKVLARLVSQRPPKKQLRALQHHHFGRKP